MPRMRRRMEGMARKRWRRQGSRSKHAPDKKFTVEGTSSLRSS